MIALASRNWASMWWRSEAWLPRRGAWRVGPDGGADGAGGHADPKGGAHDVGRGLSQNCMSPSVAARASSAACTVGTSACWLATPQDELVVVDEVDGLRPRRRMAPVQLGGRRGRIAGLEASTARKRAVPAASGPLSGEWLRRSASATYRSAVARSPSTTAAWAARRAVAGPPSCRSRPARPRL